jgi:hypothetical protein
MNDFVKRLREDPQYRASLGRARNPAERKIIATLVEGLVGGIGDILGPAIEKARNDPTFAAKLARALSEGKDVLSNSEPAPSGSSG